MGTATVGGAGREAFLRRVAPSKGGAAWGWVGVAVSPRPPTAQLPPGVTRPGHGPARSSGFGGISGFQEGSVRTGLCGGRGCAGPASKADRRTKGTGEAAPPPGPLPGRLGLAGPFGSAFLSSVVSPRGHGGHGESQPAAGRRRRDPWSKHAASARCLAPLRASVSPPLKKALEGSAPRLGFRGGVFLGKAGGWGGGPPEGRADES